MRLHDYINEIYDIADRYREDVKSALSKFMTNAQKKTSYYGGAEELDWTSLNYKTLAASMVKFIKDEATLHDQLIQLRADGKRDEVKAKMTSL